MFQKLNTWLTNQNKLAEQNLRLELESANMRDALEYYNDWAKLLNESLARDVAPSLWGRLHTALDQDAGRKYYNEMEQLRRQIIDLQEENARILHTNEFLEQTMREQFAEAGIEIQSPDWTTEAPATKPYKKKKGAA